MKERVIYVDNIPFETFTKVKVFQAANQHMRAEISGIVSKEFAVDCGKQGIYDENVSIQICGDDNKKHVWLNGIIQKFYISVCGDVYTLSLKITSYSSNSDIKKHTRTFQGIGLTYGDVVDLVCKNSWEEGCGLDVLMRSGDKGKRIDDFLVQYEETDWEFLKRLASHCHSFLFPCTSISRNGIYLGIHPYLVREELNTAEYTVCKDIKEYYYNRSDPALDCYETGAVSYIVESDHIYNLCDCLVLNGTELYIFAIESSLVGARLIHRYTLKNEHGFQTRTLYNEKLAGAALAGTVHKIQKDMVQVKLDHDITQEDYRWFPYATVYSSPDDTGWYFMPEQGDRVRLVFPDRYEKDSYVAGSVHMGDRADPDIKSIRTRYKKEVVFSPESILISNGAGSHIELDDNEGIMIYSEKPIIIESEDNIDISGKGEICITGDSGVTLLQKENRIDIGDTIDITAGRLRLR